MPTTSAAPADTGSALADTLIDGPIDSILDDFRQLCVWDERMQRVENQQFRVTYRPFNELGVLEIYDGQHNKITSGLTYNYDTGTVTISGDTGSTDYFLTYQANFFPANELYQIMIATVHAINGITPSDTRYVTSFSGVDAVTTPFQGALIFGTVAQAFKRLALQSNLWKNRLIWADGDAAAALASEMASYYQDLFIASVEGAKRQPHLAGPTSTWKVFATTGLGFSAGNGKWRELRVNRLSSF